MKRWLVLGLLTAAAFAQQSNSDMIPASPGLNIGRSNQPWNGFFNNLTITGTCTLNGLPCGLNLGANNTYTGINNFTLITNFTNAGVFTDTQMNQYVKANIGGINFLTEFQVLEGTHGVTDGFSGGVNCLPGATVLQCNGVAGYVVNSTSASIGGGMGGYFQDRATVANSHNWGSNSVVADTTGCCGAGGVTLNGAEFTVATRNAQSTYATVFGGVAVFNPSFALNNTAIGFDVENQSNGTFPINSAFRSNHGVAVTAFTAGALCFITGSVTCNSQPISLVYSNGGVPSNVSMQADSTGNINFFPTAGKALQVPIANPGSLGPTLNNYQFVDGNTNTGLQALLETAEAYPANTGLRSVLVSMPPAILLADPIPPNMNPSIRVQGGATHDTLCDDSGNHTNCPVLDHTLVLGSNADIWGVLGPVSKGGDYSGGSAMVTGANWLPPVGIPTGGVVVTCNGGGALTVPFISARMIVNYGLHAGKSPGVGYGAYKKVTGCTGVASIDVTAPTGSAVGSLAPVSYELGGGNTLNGRYFLQIPSSGMTCTAPSVDPNEGCALGAVAHITAAQSLTCTAAAFPSAVCTQPFEWDPNTGNPVDLSNVAIIFGAPRSGGGWATQTFNHQVGDLTFSCPTTGHGSNNPNVFIWNISGEEQTGTRAQTTFYGDCGGYPNIAGAYIYNGAWAPNSNWSHISCSDGPSGGAAPFYCLLVDSGLSTPPIGGAGGSSRLISDVTFNTRAGGTASMGLVLSGDRGQTTVQAYHGEQQNGNDNIFVTDGARGVFDGIEGFTTGNMIHLSSTAGPSSGHGLCPQGTNSTSQPKCSSTAVAVQDDTDSSGIQPLTGYIGLWASALSNSYVGNMTATGTCKGCGVVYNHSGTLQALSHTVSDTCTLGTNCGVTLTGSAVFTSSSSYRCAASDATAANAVRVNQTSGSAVTFTGTGTDVVSYLCIGD